MDILDNTIINIKSWFENKKNMDRHRRYDVSKIFIKDRPEYDDIIHKTHKTGIILKEDTRLELGHPLVGSCSATLVTFDVGLVEDNIITLVGPEINETCETMLPFAQIIIGCLDNKLVSAPSSERTSEIEKTSSLMDRVAHVQAQTEGYMIRSVPNLIWARVSNEAFDSGFSVQTIGIRIIHALKKRCENIIKCQIFFITSSKVDVKEIDDIVETARAKLRKLEKFEKNINGEYECTKEQDCGICPEQVVCDNIRDVIKIRKGDRIITFDEDKIVVRKE